MKLSIKYILLLIISFHIVIWYFAFYFLKINDTFDLYTNFLDFLISNQGEFYSTLLMSMITFNILLSCRLKILENFFSGLDKVYLVHKYTGYFILLLLLMHNAFINSTADDSLARYIANPIFFSFLLLIFISALPHIPFINKILNIPYHIWKWSHKFMGILFLFGMYHSLGVQSLTFNNQTLSAYMYLVYFFGIAGFLYSTIFYNLFTKRYKYKVKEINNLNKEVVEIYLENIFDKKDEEKYFKNSISWRAGQFAFYEFLEKGIRETHPFTISNFNKEGLLRISVKSLGDWTKNFKDKIKIGTEVFIDGPYGYFNSQKDNARTEIWIAGGIGVTPFLSMMQDYKLNKEKINKSKKIIFIWSVKNLEESIYKKEIEDNIIENINFKLWDVQKSGYFKFHNILNDVKKYSDLENVSVYICGPAIMRKEIIKEAKSLNIKDFYYEEFNFR